MDRYKPIKQIGKGSFGNALLVQPIDQPTKNLVMKIIDISKLDRKQKEEAVNEVHVLKALRHPFIVAYRESFVEKQCLCIVMDYADGGDLQTKINTQKQKHALFSEDQILDWFVQICLALKHIHDRQILHRDIKAQNIFLTSKDEVKLGDFGIARILRNEEDYARTAIGTPYYLSPEICDGRPYNQKSDIWSLGCILHQMITLRHAFDGNSIKELMKKIMSENYSPLPSGFSQDLHQLVSEMLTKDPTQRPSINEVLQKKFLSVFICWNNKRVSMILKGTLSVKSSIADSNVMSESKKTLYKNQSEKGLHFKRSESYNLYKASFHAVKADLTTSPRIVGHTKNQPSQSQGVSDGFSQTQIDFTSHSEYFPDLGSLPSLRPASSKNEYKLRINFNRPSQPENCLKTPRMMINEVSRDDRPKAPLKDRPKSHEKYQAKSPGLVRKTIETTHYSSVSEINNIINENLSFINLYKMTPQTNCSVLSHGLKESPSYKMEGQRKIILSSMMTPREDNQTPEGDLINIIHLLAESDVKKEIGPNDIGVGVKAKKNLDMYYYNSKGNDVQPNNLYRAGDKNSLEFEGIWTLLEEKLGTPRLEKAYGYMKLNENKKIDVKQLLKIIGDRNLKYVRELEKLMQFKK